MAEPDERAGPPCRICGSGPTRTITAYEMMFGTRDAFDYHACDACGCVQIAAYPPDMGRYYPEGYYSFHPGGSRRLGGVERWVRRQRALHALGRGGLVGSAVDRVVGHLEAYSWLSVAGVTLDSAVLDVGCGNGFLLSNLHKDGFDKLEGVDPFASDAARQQDGFAIRTSLAEVQAQPDFVLLSHSFEHMPEQLGVLRALHRIVASHTWVCIRIPLANEAWRRFGVDWVQLDPPRHFYLHTARSFRQLAEQAGFRIVRTDFDSSGMQFWGSEQIRRGIPFADPRGHAHAIGGAGRLFSAEELAAWEREAEDLNRRREGDQATFYLQTA